MLRARLSPMLGQVLPRLLEVAQQPGKLARGIGGTLLLSLSHIFCLAACVAAFGRSVPIARIGVVYLIGSGIGSIMPTPAASARWKRRWPPGSRPRACRVRPRQARCCCSRC
jgi:uncharacterized membrane protein YbhN (UPF0104 family)